MEIYVHNIQAHKEYVLQMSNMHEISLRLWIYLVTRRGERIVTMSHSQ